MCLRLPWTTTSGSNEPMEFCSPTSLQNSEIELEVASQLGALKAEHGSFAPLHCGTYSRKMSGGTGDCRFAGYLRRVVQGGHKAKRSHETGLDAARAVGLLAINLQGSQLSLLS